MALEPATVLRTTPRFPVTALKRVSKEVVCIALLSRWLVPQPPAPLLFVTQLTCFMPEQIYVPQQSDQDLGWLYVVKISRAAGYRHCSHYKALRVSSRHLLTPSARAKLLLFWLLGSAYCPMLPDWLRL